MNNLFLFSIAAVVLFLYFDTQLEKLRHTVHKQNQVIAYMAMQSGALHGSGARGPTVAMGAPGNGSRVAPAVTQEHFADFIPTDEDMANAQQTQGWSPDGVVATQVSADEITGLFDDGAFAPALLD